ncbi:LOW QUALITY PROTEIN: proteasome activator complex subunit 4B-like [Saccostrea cucullata]|uniref:LOW QUALITY PROTEIN: proteasome activator complex subunit 4B-like n=1 Tax=Saccostrea cuccullata TaxID=36930 RepID=UPI002ED64023
METREEALGFKPQKDKIYNKFLPYAENIDDESNAALAEIKGNLAKAVLLRDVKVGATFWVGQLTRYIRLYGMKFSKEDHILFIKLLFELTTIPDLELSLVPKFATQLVALLKKQKLLTREDLELPWKPIYQLVENVAYSPYEHHGLQLFPHNMEHDLKNLVNYCRTYFPLSATQEMLDEWRPLLCPFDVTNIKAIHYFEYFLPTDLLPENHDKGFKLWLDEFLNMWHSYQNAPTWEAGLVRLFARLAHDTIGYIDWSPHVSMVFNRFMRSFNLPVGMQKVQVGRSNNTYDIGATVTWIVSMMGGPSGSLVQDHIDSFFKALQSFFHPSNLGKWNIKLSGLLMNFPKLVVKRIHRERYKKKEWLTEIPADHKLKDSEITRFVKSMQPVVSVSMFSKYGSHDSAVALRHLSNMRPELIIPDLLEKMYPAMENLIEPHRLIACMNCVVAVSRPMLSARRWYPEGRSHVLPLLNLALPGIDPNDFKKCLVTFQMISTFVAQVPIVDCSEAVFIRDDLSDEEKELCSATAQFEDFVLLFLDRVFALIENSTQEHTHGDPTRLNPEQTMMEVALSSTFTSVLLQCSTPIYESALSRLYNFITTSVYETNVGGRFAANLCRAAAKANPKRAVEKFLPPFCKKIKDLMTEHEEYKTEEHLDDGFLWNLLMLSQLVRCNGEALLPYKDQLLEVLQMTLHLKCVQGYELSCQLMRYTLRALTLHFPLDYRSVAGSFDRPVSEYLAINDWAIPGDMDDLGMKWHIPSADEIEFAQSLMDHILQPELEKIMSLSSSNQIDKEELLQRLSIILECLLGAGAALPAWKSTSVDLSSLNVKTQVPLDRFHVSSVKELIEIQYKGANLRLEVVKAMKHLLNYLMECTEDDTKSLSKLIKIYETILFFYGASKQDFDARWKSLHSVKDALEDKMRDRRKHIRALLVDRVVLQQEMRMLYGLSGYTDHHQDILCDLYNLAVSKYAEVRKKGQAVLMQCFLNFPYCYRCLLDRISDSLIQKDTPEKQFKGVLYVVLGSGKRCLATKRSWEVIGQLWPAIVQAQQSEKPSILRVVDDIIAKVSKNLESPGIEIKVTSSCLEAAQKLLSSGVPVSSPNTLTEGADQRGEEFQIECNESNNRMYVKIVEDLVALVKGGTLMWKFSQYAVELLTLLLRHDVPTPPVAVELFVSNLIHDSLYIRKLSMASVSAILKQQKRKHKKVVVDPYRTAPPPPAGTFLPGNRPDNNWIMYDSGRLPDNQEKWEAMEFVDKTHWGYYCWPKEMKIYAQYSEQPKLDRLESELLDIEKPIYVKLSDSEFVKKFIGVLSLEEHKGRDKFRNKHLTLFKGLFRNYGDTFLPHFRSHIVELLSDRSHEHHESKQRCGMEILAGVIRGSKHWPYEKVNALWDWVIPILRTSLDNITSETLKDWGTFFTVVSESRDPRRLYRLFEMLMDKPIREGSSSFEDSSRLFAVQNALVQQEWRVPELLHRLLEFLTPYLSHRYKNVRDRIGSLLSNIMLYDYSITAGSSTKSPHRVDFVQKVIPQLEPLKDLVLSDNGNNGSSKDEENHREMSSLSEKMEVEDDEDEERKTTIRLCKTVLKWISDGLGRMFTSTTPELFLFLPVICTLESETKDEELKTDCSMALACFSQALIQENNVTVCLETIREVMGLKSWHSRVAILGYIQVMVFCNLFTMIQTKHKKEIQNFILHLICDDQVENNSYIAME